MSHFWQNTEQLHFPAISPQPKNISRSQIKIDGVPLKCLLKYHQSISKHRCHNKTENIFFSFEQKHILSSVRQIYPDTGWGIIYCIGPLPIITQGPILPAPRLWPLWERPACLSLNYCCCLQVQVTLLLESSHEKIMQPYSQPSVTQYMWLTKKKRTHTWMFCTLRLSFQTLTSKYNASSATPLRKGQDKNDPPNQVNCTTTKGLKIPTKL